MLLAFNFYWFLRKSVTVYFMCCEQGSCRDNNQINNIFPRRISAPKMAQISVLDKYGIIPNLSNTEEKFQ